MNTVPTHAEIFLDDSQFGCFARHLNEAIALNQERMPRYSALSNGESEKISKRLIRYEKLSLLAAYYFDWKAKKYQKAGIPIFCDEFVSMSMIPPFQMWHSDANCPLKVLPRLDISSLKSQIRHTYQQEGFHALTRFLKVHLSELKKERPYQCLVRHVLESILRTSRLAPQHNSQALAAGLSPTEGLSWEFIQLQLWVLSSAEKMDFDALPIQAKGISIICGDVPQID